MRVRLAGFAFNHPDGPVRSGYLPMDELTVVLGPNDAGKSRLVAALARHLLRLPDVREEAGGHEAAFVVVLDGIEAEAMRHRLTREIGIRALVEQGLPYCTAAEHDAVVAALERATTFAIENTDPARVFWVIPDGALDPDLAERMQGAEEMPPGGRELPKWALLDATPVCLDLGLIDAQPLPLPVEVPIAWETIADRLAAAVDSLLKLLGCLSDVSVLSHIEVDDDPELLAHAVSGLADSAVCGTELPDRADLWLEPTGPALDGVRISGDVQAVTGIWRDAAQDLLPSPDLAAGVVR